jgi:hypothetical protein
MHSPEFKAVRDAILDDLEDADRRRIAALLGAMTEPQPELSPELVRVLAAIMSLGAEDRARLSKWCGRYLNRWGQIPQAASLKTKPR